MNIAMIIAGGVGRRMGSSVPKQFLEIRGKPVLAYTLEAFQRHRLIDAILVVTLPDWREDVEVIARDYGISKFVGTVEGGDCGQASIRHGVYALRERYEATDLVLVHDAIRPLVSKDIISDCIVVARRRGNAIAVIPCAEAMLTTADGEVSTGIFPRDDLKRTQTPQCFRIGDLAALHDEALERGITDSVASCTLAIELGREVFFSVGSELNVKLTTPDDLVIFEALLDARDRIRSMGTGGASL